MTEPRTKAGKRLLQVMGTVPPQGRKGLAWFVDAIETEARNLGYADRLDVHINGLCGATNPQAERLAHDFALLVGTAYPKTYPDVLALEADLLTFLSEPRWDADHA